jgi:hypothetical protein
MIMIFVGGPVVRVLMSPTLNLVYGALDKIAGS